MKRKVEIFTNWNPEQLQDDINKYLEKIGKNYIDIKYAYSSYIKNEYNDLGDVYSAMIVYYSNE